MFFPDTHCSVEDSLAAIQLYRMVEKEWDGTSSCLGNKRFLDDTFWPDWLDPPDPDDRNSLLLNVSK